MLAIMSTIINGNHIPLDQQIVVFDCGPIGKILKKRDDDEDLVEDIKKSTSDVQLSDILNIIDGFYDRTG